MSELPPSIIEVYLTPLRERIRELETEVARWKTALTGLQKDYDMNNVRANIAEAKVAAALEICNSFMIGPTTRLEWLFGSQIHAALSDKEPEQALKGGEQ